MVLTQRFVVAVLVAMLSVPAFWPVNAEEAAHPAAHAPAAPASHGCLTQKERRAATDSGHVIRLASAMRAAKRRMPGSVVRARLCHGRDDLVYVLTVLARDGKVARLTVDAVKGTLVSGR